MSIKVPADLYEAIRLAAKAEGKSQNELIVDVLTSALSRIPGPPREEHED
ncbi:MAG: ribbon-helix-helix protein, CopG family [Candidatus Hydrogenedentes bacterium]|nr:ribbon-helix-helix protein, CopG family [Candidatus Hydrogenedentota bacterium]